MATDITIDQLPTASTIDATQDILPIYTASATATQGITRNTLLGLASAPIGLTDTQTLTNKTLTSPTIASPTFSGTLAGTYTIGGTPTFPSSVAQLTATQTLTNKTLTSPTINSPTITNATITADTLAGYTTTDDGTVYGVSITSGVVASAALAGSVNTAAIQSAAVTPVKLATHTYIGVIAAASMESTGNLSITGIGFKPQLVRFTFLAVASATDASGAVGAMTASSQFWSGNASEGSSGSWRYSSTTHCFGWMARSDTPGLEAAFVSMDSGGFTVNITTASSSGSISGVAYEAYG